MKNIHILPTENYSPLVHSTSRYGGFFKSEHYSPMKEMGDSYQHIYITSDSDIKEGDLILPPSNIPVRYDGQKYKGDEPLKCWKKIILTTDADLIKDGVQKIDDEFLEWFIKNPSCEEIEVDFDVIVTRTKSLLQNQDGKTIAIPHRIHYRIIIPKEEPKQIKCYCGHTTYCDCGPLEEPKDVVLGYKTSIVAQMLDRIDLEEPKQETLEEAAENFVNSTRLRNYKVLFIEGAKWNQEQILQFLYSEITERRPYSSSKMCEKVIEFIEQLNTKK
jgi:hypothetical protein